MDNEEKLDNEEPIDDISFDDEGNEDGASQIKKLREKVARLEKEKQEYLDLSQRLRADYVNFKKEVDVRRGDDIRFANKGLIEELLPTLDSFFLAKANKEAWEKVDANWRSGIEYIFTNLVQTLEKEGVRSYGEVGDAISPTNYESVSLVPTDDKEKDQTVATVLQRGYLYGETVLRPAKVTVFEYTEN